jgi:mRNA-degrading endonuclease RelE of RelBE toxin-antitoxin system
MPRKPPVLCRLEVSPAARRAINGLPGNIRQRVRRAIASLAQDPRPAPSKLLDFMLPAGEPRRLRIGRWRVVYAVIGADPCIVAVVAVRRRPPYQYEDLIKVFGDIG